MLGDTSGALKDFSRAIKVDPNFANSYFNRAMFYYNNNQQEKACNDFKKAYELGNSNALSQINSKCK